MDPHWESDLEALMGLLENPPPPGSEGELCIDTLLQRVLRSWREQPDTPPDHLRDRLDQLSAHIAEIEARRALEHPDWEAGDRAQPGHDLPLTM